MDFEPSPRTRELLDRLQVFMDEQVLPAEPVYDAKANTLRLLGAWGDTTRLSEAMRDLAAWLGASMK